MDIKIGDIATLEKTFSMSDVRAFSELSEDRNPVHLNEYCAKKFGFPSTIVHGILSSSLLSALIGTKLPGEGSVYLEQNIKFKRPIFVNEKIKAEVTVINIRKDKPIISLDTKVYKENNELAIDGTAVVLFKGNKSV